MPRLFVAARPPEAVLAAVAALPRPVSPGVRWVPAAQWHVTLRFLGEAPIDAVVAALEGCGDELAAVGPVDAVAGPQVSRLGRSVVCLPVAGLDRLAAVVCRATATLGQPLDPRPFIGHLTLARLKGRAACGVTGHPSSARFPVDEIEVVRSRLGPGGAAHDVVARVPIGR